MASREVTMLEVREILRQWLGGAARKRIAGRLSCDPKTVRRYVRAASRLGLVPGQDEQALTDEVCRTRISCSPCSATRAHAGRATPLGSAPTAPTSTPPCKWKRGTIPRQFSMTVSCWPSLPHCASSKPT